MKLDRTKLAFGAASIVLLGALIACGGDDDDDGSSSGTSGNTSSSGASGTTISRLAVVMRGSAPHPSLSASSDCWPVPNGSASSPSP